MSDSGQQIGACPHSHTPDVCLTCLRERVATLERDLEAAIAVLAEHDIGLPGMLPQRRQWVKERRQAADPPCVWPDEADEADLDFGKIDAARALVAEGNERAWFGWSLKQKLNYWQARSLMAEVALAAKGGSL